MSGIHLESVISIPWNEMTHIRTHAHKELHSSYQTAMMLWADRVYTAGR